MATEHIDQLYSQLERTSQGVQSTLNLVKDLQTRPEQEYSTLPTQHVRQLRRLCVQLEEDVRAVRRRIEALPGQGDDWPRDDDDDE